MAPTIGGGGGRGLLSGGRAHPTIAHSLAAKNTRSISLPNPQLIITVDKCITPVSVERRPRAGSQAKRHQREEGESLLEHRDRSPCLSSSTHASFPSLGRQDKRAGNTIKVRGGAAKQGEKCGGTGDGFFLLARAACAARERVCRIGRKFRGGPPTTKKINGVHIPKRTSYTALPGSRDKRTHPSNESHDPSKLERGTRPPRDGRGRGAPMRRRSSNAASSRRTSRA